MSYLNNRLSICIPTFNRAKVLRETLFDLIPKIEEYGIAIYVSDNASTDDTKAVVEEAQKRYEHILYSCNERNLGADRNFQTILELAQSDYCWLLGDDDRIKSVKEVLDILQENDFDLIVVNGNNRVSGIDSKVFTDQNDLLATLGWHMTWMSCLIYNKKVVRDANFVRYYDTNFLQLGIIFEYLANKEIKVYWNRDQLVYGSYICTYRDKIFLIFMENWFLTIFSLPPSYSYQAKVECIKSHGINIKLFSFKGFLNLRLEGLYNFGIYLNYKKYFYFTTNISNLVLLIICFIPRKFLKLLKSIKGIIK